MLQFHATDFGLSKWGNSRQADSHGRETSDKMRKEAPISKMTTKYCTLLFSINMGSANHVDIGTIVFLFVNFKFSNEQQTNTFPSPKKKSFSELYS